MLFSINKRCLDILIKAYKNGFTPKSIFPHNSYLKLLDAELNGYKLVYTDEVVNTVAILWPHLDKQLIASVKILTNKE